MSNKSIEIENIGPIRDVSIPLNGRGGVLVFRGRNGLGKSTAIGAVEAALRGEGALDVRRGAARGTVDVCGVSIRVGRNTRRSGELEVVTLEGRLSVAELVDPGLKDDGAADRVRMRALLHVVQYDASACGPRFRALLPGDNFDRIVAAESLGTSDPVEMAARVKRDLEEEARRIERDAEALAARAKGLEDSAGGIPIELRSESELAAALSTATLELERAEEHNRRVGKAKAERDKQAATLDAWMTASAGKVSVSQASLALEDAAMQTQIAVQAVADAESALRLAKSTLERAQATQRTASATLAEAKTREQAIEACRAGAAVVVDDEIPADKLAALGAAKVQAEHDVAQGGVRRKAWSDREHAAELRGEASDKTTFAMKLRDAGRATDDVLTDLVSGCGVPLTINQGRIVYRDESGERLFHELSMGEKYRIGLSIAIQAGNRLAGDEGVLLTLPQEAWESLDPINRRAIAIQAEEGACWIITAEATGDEQLTARKFDVSNLELAS